MPEPRTINAAEALREAMDLALERWPDVFLMGEGVADPKGIFGTTAGLADKHGRARVVEMPVSENGLTGVAIGAALMGRRPVLVHQRVDFALLSIEQLFNSAAKSHYVTGGRHRVPLVVRMVIGRGWGQGPQHSQSLEAIFAHVPGLKVVMAEQGAGWVVQTLAGWDRTYKLPMFRHMTQAMPLTLPGIEQLRYLVVAKKVAQTPATYPRRAGIPAKKPL